EEERGSVALMSADMSRKSRSRLLAALLGALFGLLIIVAIVYLRGGRKAVGFVRTTKEATKLLEARSKAISALGKDGRATQTGHLPRFPITYEIARTIFPIEGEVQEFDPLVYFRHPANMQLTI